MAYNKERFIEHDRIYNWNPKSDQLKLKEWERIILYMGFKTITFWNVSDENCKKFIVIKFEDEWTEETEFYDVADQETKSFSSRKLKTIKKIDRKRLIDLKDFIPTYVRSFPMPMSKYVLPERKVLVYKWN